MNVILAGLSEPELMSHAYPAFAASGWRVMAVVASGEKLAQIAPALSDGVVVVEANLYPSAQEAVAALAALSPVRVVVILPSSWQGQKEQFAALPNLVTGHTMPVSWAQVVLSLKGHAAAVSPPPSRTQATPPESVRDMPVSSPGDRAREIEPDLDLRLSMVRQPGPSVRLGLYGTRGGAGTSSAALAAARVLAGEGQRVCLFDASKRGDLHLMMGVSPGDQPIERGGITLFLGSPTEDVVRGLDAVIVDGGRTKGTFNAHWVPVDRPLAEDRIRRLVDLEPREKEGRETVSGDGPKHTRSFPRFSLSNLISIEVTE